MTQNCDLGKIKKKIGYQLSKENTMPPIDMGFSPPRNVTLDLFKAMEENKLAHINLITTKINQCSIARGTGWDWSKLETKKNELKELFQSSNKAINDNKASGSRFREIARENMIAKRNLLLQIDNVENEIEEYRETYEKMKKYVNEYSLYERFLESVVQDSSEFNSVGDILNRYKTLENTRKECGRLLEEELEDNSDMRKAMAALVDEKSSQRKILRNKLVMRQVNMKQAKVRRMHWEHMLQRMKNTITNKEEEELALNGACWDLYRQCCIHRKTQPVAGQDDLNAQLEFIRNTLMFYREVYTVAAAKHVQNTA